MKMVMRTVDWVMRYTVVAIPDFLRKQETVKGRSRLLADRGTMVESQKFGDSDTRTFRHGLRNTGLYNGRKWRRVDLRVLWEFLPEIGANNRPNISTEVWKQGG